MRGRVLIVAGSDPSGGAGIQADIKTVTSLGGYAMTAVTALTAQNTLGVTGVFPIPTEFIAQQMRVVLEDIPADVVKTGMLATTEVIRTVAAVLDESAPNVPLVVDPVMIAKSGDSLLDPSAVDAVRTQMVPRAAVLTPNLREAEVLCGRGIRTVGEMEEAARTLAGMGARTVLVKGGHREGAVVQDVLLTEGGVEVLESPRLETTSTHGTGCTLASAIATGLAQEMPVRDAVVRALDYVHNAIRFAPGFGHGRGPLNHGYVLESTEEANMESLLRGLIGHRVAVWSGHEGHRDEGVVEEVDNQVIRLRDDNGKTLYLVLTSVRLVKPFDTKII